MEESSSMRVWLELFRRQVRFRGSLSSWAAEGAGLGDDMEKHVASSSHRPSHDLRLSNLALRRGVAVVLDAA
jgi:hypothetical protein